MRRVGCVLSGVALVDFGLRLATIRGASDMILPYLVRNIAIRHEFQYQDMGCQ